MEKQHLGYRTVQYDRVRRRLWRSLTRLRLAAALAALRRRLRGNDDCVERIMRPVRAAAWRRWSDAGDE